MGQVQRPSVLVRARPDLDDDLASARAASARAAAAAALASVVAAASIHLARATPPAIAAAASASEASGYVGVGLEVYVAPDGYPTVIEFLPTKTSGPAHDAGVRINDKIAAVNGAETRAMRCLADVASALRGGGAGGDAVELTLLRRRGRTTETVAASVTRVGGITPNPRSCFVSSCARV
ncbi:PDZ domain protease [Micromonas pusilla CCMP1545]|uniref:PDZ domain protease n=1 Tax=Micromonas pusilla (strain CCMP1545) TaxID=564608 RepID=C1MJQ5_MICPC|nr:PDZ domain protease [Micromonas pusilla CCMP1545]EEH59237.1 PDZ domain protease [Micromonas pusilla CCMP1545]|eukprot:XP_003055861.1 PDZ domain protease [Micromonas pusilla CCMP1545]